MPSLRSHFFRLIVKYFVGTKFKRVGTSLAEWRKLDELFTKDQKLPTGTEIEPVVVNGITAEWVRAPAAQTDNVVLYLHGGGFMICSAATHRELAARLSAAARARFLVIDYRLAPEHPFPAAMQDALSAYHWLLDQGYTEKQLVIGGDSAGGGLALQTLLVLRGEGDPLPAGAFFMSPVTDMVRFDGESYSTRADLDIMLSLEMSKFGMAHYVGDNDSETPLLSPVNMDLSGLPPLCVHVGDHEVLLGDSIRLAERARASNVEVEFKIWPGMWHMFQIGARFVPEARQSIDKIGHFVVNHVG
jgi:monoterpene epsilon-lactone hydrolase